MLPQPDETTCGPTCLHAIYEYFGDHVPLESVIARTRRLKSGGTLAVLLACDALRRGYSATLYTYNLEVFDPTWFEPGDVDFTAKLRAQRRRKGGKKLRVATAGYLEFLKLGGAVRFEDLSGRLVRSFLDRGIPVLTGLSATYLYRTPREHGPKADYDDVRGRATGHFVVLIGYDREERTVLVADPLVPNPRFPTPTYEIGVDRLLNAILLGNLTYDDNLLVIEPKPRPRTDDSARKPS